MRQEDVADLLVRFRLCISAISSSLTLAAAGHLADKPQERLQEAGHRSLALQEVEQERRRLAWSLASRAELEGDDYPELERRRRGQYDRQTDMGHGASGPPQQPGRLPPASHSQQLGRAFPAPAASTQPACRGCGSKQRLGAAG
eukprot:722028-Hanusia_phi.AAC.1